MFWNLKSKAQGSFKVLEVDHYELIRRMHYVDGLSQRAIASKLGHSRKTVKKALARAAPLPHKSKGGSRQKPTLGRFIPIIDAWLKRDLDQPRKQRHTAQRIYERLCAEHEYTGHSSTIRRYVGEAKRRLVGQEVFMPLAFDPGEEAQVDWGEATIIQNGQPRKVQLFCMRLCFSKRCFVRAYERANLESFLDGHVRAFEFFSAVPQRLAYDNLKSAVIRVGRGTQRDLNKTFVKLRSWYLFASRFCNVARGNEKGHVENLVKRAQRSFMTPVPEVEDLEQLNKHLFAACRAEPVDTESWEREQEAMLALPADPFPACVESSSKVDKQSLVHIANHSYSVPVRWAHWPCVVQAFVDRVEIYCDHQQVACHTRSYGPDPFVLEPSHYIPLLERKPGCFGQARPFKGSPWGPDFELLRSELEYRYGGEGTKQFINILLLFPEHGEGQVRAAVHFTVKRRAFSEQAVLHALRTHPTPPPPKRLDLFTKPELRDVGNGIRPAAIYDQLMTRSSS